MARILDDGSLGPFLAAFYARVRSDPLIGPVFAAAIPDADWPRHMAVIEAFWSSVLFRTGRYRGNPFGRHQALGVLRPEHFARWLTLFRDTAASHFAPEEAAALQERAERIGASLQAGLFFRPEDAGAADPAADAPGR
ncbi:group III truncated hemoglobin [Methylobacterium nonmethylotrophicum]|uniref:Group III truncated hemoglobin n=1 Tax=Methylobacterium nonmethylotrophicum TaxID=1141884 RepID=A0A4Z0NL94_9HYPH|nr:group III truncated hemoglobin [Methylobacterium nonmethylotrophicum]TGD97217.1 group III truncated hemoglobin [Methylobacterium nonmethylotrophicum]